MRTHLNNITDYYEEVLRGGHSKTKIGFKEIFRRHDPRKHTFIFYLSDGKMLAIHPSYNSFRDEYSWSVYGDYFISDRIGVKYDFNELINELLKHLFGGIKKIEVYYGECQYYDSECKHVATYDNVNM